MMTDKEAETSIAEHMEKVHINIISSNPFSKIVPFQSKTSLIAFNPE
jgi:hypothetical protein